MVARWREASLAFQKPVGPAAADGKVSGNGSLTGGQTQMASKGNELRQEGGRAAQQNSVFLGEEADFPTPKAPGLPTLRSPRLLSYGMFSLSFVQGHTSSSSSSSGEKKKLSEI